MSWPWAPPPTAPAPPEFPSLHQFGSNLPPPPPQFSSAPPPPNFGPSYASPPPFVAAPYGQFGQPHYPPQQNRGYSQQHAYPPFQVAQHHSPQQYGSDYRNFPQPPHHFAHFQHGRHLHGVRQQSHRGGKQSPHRPQGETQGRGNRRDGATSAPAPGGVGVPARQERRAQPRSIERELALTKEVLTKLGKTLPGDSPEEIARYVAERKRNWPRASRVINKPPLEPADALAQLAAGYADNGSDAGSDDDAVVKGAVHRDGTGRRGKRYRAGRDRGRARSQGNRVREPPLKKRRPSLIAELLRKDILRERHVLLQAIAHFVRKKEQNAEKADI